MNSRFAVATHLLVYLAFTEGQPASSEVLARSLGSHPVVVRRLVGALRKAGLVDTQLGAGGGARLARPVEGVTLLDVFEAMQEPEPDMFALSNTNPSTHCGVGSVMRQTLEELFAPAEEAMRQALATVTLSQVMQRVKAQVPASGGCLSHSAE
jgi:Rrf2 family protein